MTDRSLTDPTELRRLAEAAAPGPWSIQNGEIVADDGEILGVVFRTEAWSSGEPIDHEDQVNAAYIAAANPQAVLALLDRLDCQSALCAAMSKWLANQQHWTDLPDDHAVLESRGTEGEFRITAGMIREANR